MPDYGAGLDDWMGQAPQEPAPTYMGKSMGGLLEQMLTPKKPPLSFDLYPPRGNESQGNNGILKAPDQVAVPPPGPAPAQEALRIPVTNTVGDSIDAAASKYGLSPATLKGIASIESSWNPGSNRNRSTQYKGLFQIGKDEWKQYGSGDIYNAQDNANAAARMLRDHSDWFKDNYGREPTPGDLYMMHQQGRGFISNGTMTNISGNPYPGMRGPQTPESFRKGWSDTLDRKMAQYGDGDGGAQTTAASAAPQESVPKYMGKSLSGMLDQFLGGNDGAQSAAEAAAARVRAPYTKANERTSGLPQILQHYGESLGSILTAPKRALTGEMQVNDPETNMPTKEAMGEAGSLAGILAGGGMPMAERGALGMAGGKLTQKTGDVGDIIKAFHGFPHDFDRFDLSKIGTGEGAQAYGHGLYFAENEGVAKGYRDNLVMRGHDTFTPADPRSMAAKAKRNEASYQELLDDGASEFEYDRRPMLKMPDGSVVEWGPDGISAAHNWPQGKMYEVGIKANPDHFLDWDKPLSEQHPKVRAALTKAPARAAAEHFGYDPAEFAALPRNRQQDLISKTPKSAYDLGNMTGATAYQQLSTPGERYATQHFDSSAAAQRLREAGIPGIKYLDQGSRGKGDGTRNYVVFDHNLIDILKKYGIAGIGALPAMNAFHYQKKDGS